MSAVPCGWGEKGGPSAGVAVAARRHIGMAKVPDMVSSGELEHRFCVRWTGSTMKGGLFIASVYLYSSELLSSRNVRLLEEVARVLLALPGPWVLGGDFQMEPKLLIQSGFVRLAKGVLAAPSKPTCQGHVIDYFVVSESLRHSVVAVSTLEDSPFAPTLPFDSYLRQRRGSS